MTRSVRVVIVDDSPVFLRAAAKLVVATIGFELVGQAGSGEEAVALTAAIHPDLVLMDVRMPGLGGLEAARLIRQAESETAVILMTADSGVAAASAGLDVLAVTDKRSLTPANLTALWRQHRDQ